MCSESDFEKLWFMYKTQGEPKGVSINKFCVINNVPYKALNNWFRKTQKRVVPVVIEGKHSIFRLDAHYSQTYLCAITK